LLFQQSRHRDDDVEPSIPVTTILRIDGYAESLRKATDFRAFYTNNTSCSTVASAILEVAARKKAQVISYDVFDTVLLREQHSEAGRFLKISERFTKACKKATFNRLFLLKMPFWRGSPPLVSPIPAPPAGETAVSKTSPE
jgi:hypothetical protein